VIHGIIEYTEANAAILYLVNDENAGNKYLEAIAHFGGNKEKTDKKIEIGEGQVGTCFKEKKIIELNEVSDNYYKISSGLGNDMPKHIAFVPLKHDELVLGVLEIASFLQMKGYKIMLLEKLAENITSTLATERANARLKKMIEKSEMQAREMALQEEEMRKNMEEMMSTQEEAARREDELIQMAEESASREEELNARISELENEISELQEKTNKSIKN